MKRSAPKLNGAALRAAVAAIESPVVGDQAFSLMAAQMGITALLGHQPPPDGFTDLSATPRATRKQDKP